MGKDIIFFPVLLPENQTTMDWEGAGGDTLWDFLSLVHGTI